MEIQLKRSTDKKLEVLIDGEQIKHVRSVDVRTSNCGSSEICINLVDIDYNLTFYPKSIVYRNTSTGVEYVLQERWKYRLNVELYQLLGDILTRLREDPADGEDRLMLHRVKDILIPYLHGKDEDHVEEA